MKYDEVDDYVDQLFRQYPSERVERIAATVEYAVENPDEATAQQAVVDAGLYYWRELTPDERARFQQSFVEQYHAWANAIQIEDGAPLTFWGLLKGLLLLVAGLLLIMWLNEVGVLQP